MVEPLLAQCGLQWDEERKEFFLRLDGPQDHLCITPPRIDDCDLMYKVLNVESVHSATYSIPHPFSLEAVTDWTRRLLVASRNWSDVLRDGDLEKIANIGGLPFDTIREGMDGPFIGSISLQMEENVKSRAVVDTNIAEPSKYLAGNLTISRGIWRVAYYMDPLHSGQGIITAALRRVLRFIADLTRLVDFSIASPTVRAATWDSNFASMRVLEKSGFKPSMRSTLVKNGVELPFTRFEWQGFPHLE